MGLTYKDIMNRFKDQNPNLVDEIVEYRPHGKMTIKIELRHGLSITVFYDDVMDYFSIINVKGMKA